MRKTEPKAHQVHHSIHVVDNYALKKPTSRISPRFLTIFVTFKVHCNYYTVSGNILQNYLSFSAITDGKILVMFLCCYISKGTIRSNYMYCIINIFLPPGSPENKTQTTDVSKQCTNSSNFIQSNIQLLKSQKLPVTVARKKFSYFYAVPSSN